MIHIDRITLILILSLTVLLTNVPPSAFADDINPFHFDGCSTVAEGTAEEPNLWCACCLEHDIRYWKGGTWTDRRNADLEFKDCVSEMSGNEALGGLFYLGVRMGGSPYYRTDYRWGYGWDYGRGYKTLTAREEADAEGLLQEWFADHPDACMD
jgi:hypothetical protein